MASAMHPRARGAHGHLIRRTAAGAITVAAVAIAIAIAIARAPTAATATPHLTLAAEAVATQGPLEFTEVALSQQDVRMSLRVATSGAWTAAGVVANELCVTLVHGAPALARGRICLTRRVGRAALSYAPLNEDGTAHTPRRLAASVTRPTANAFEATFLPAAASLPVGSYSWFATSAWTDPVTCPNTCKDRFPEDGVVDANLAMLGAKPCFGAAARDPVQPCENPELALSVQPSVARSQDRNESFCDKRERKGLLSICSFGAPPDDAADTFALLGDSHASGLKPALEVLTLARRWRGRSMIRAACPPTQAVGPILPTPLRSRQCQGFNRQALAWLDRHREVNTVFLAAHVTAMVRRAPGRTMDETRQLGYRDEIRALLRSTDRVVVIRDPPYSSLGQLGCVGTALSNGHAPGIACALSRRAAVQPDPLVLAAESLRSPRVRVIDLTQHYCDDVSCFPVIGGALVQRDKTHLTSTFSATLGPYILRALGD